MKLKLLIGLLLSASLVGCGGDGKDGTNGTDGTNASAQVIGLKQAGRTTSQGFDVSAAEILDFDKTNKRIMVVNANSGKVDVFNATTLSSLNAPASSLNLAQMLVDNKIVSATSEVGAANSLSVHGDLMTVAVEANPKTNTGWAVFIKLSDLSFSKAVTVGALPDMLTFTKDGSTVLVANEGEPSTDYSIDPEGSISIIKVSDFSVTTLGFTDFNTGGSKNSSLPTSKMILDGYSATNSGNKASVAQSLEPEYIAFNADNTKAYVALQENNAYAVIDLSKKSIEKIIGLGFKDYSIPGNELDASNKDGVNIRNWAAMGMYMPDSIATFTYEDKTYLLTANEGDSREDWLNEITDQTKCESAGYYFKSKCRDELQLKDLSDSDLTITGTPLAGLDTDTTLGRLKFSYFTTKVKNGGTSTKKLYAFGGRSFSIWDAETGEQIFDSGSRFERLTALKYGENFNNNNKKNSGDSRSDDKGPEPEALTTGQINGHTYAFIGLERMGGIMVYEISNPYAPSYVQYISNRDLTVTPSASTDAGDLGPEGFKFVSASDSPSGKPLLLVASEVSGTTTAYEINVTNLQ